MYVLEPEDLAQARGAPILACIEAMAVSHDTSQAAGLALKQAALSTDDLAEICGPMPLPGFPDIPLIHVAPTTGLAEACQPLLDLAASLKENNKNNSKPTHVLSLLPTRHDHAHALLLRPVLRSLRSDSKTKQFQNNRKAQDCS